VEIGSEKETGRQSKKLQFELIGGHPATNLVNTLDWRFRESGAEELLNDYSDLVLFVEQSGLVSSADARRLLRTVPETKGRRVLAMAQELREAAAAVLYSILDERSPPASAIQRLQECAREAKQYEELHWDGSKLEWAVPHSPAPPEFPLCVLSLNTAEFVTSEKMSLLRQCGNAECRWLFIDTSKNHTRRWCDMKICGNRMKARRFKAQHH
jgi:predicted RNA-binding Zn ribbon-like protein